MLRAELSLLTFIGGALYLCGSIAVQEPFVPKICSGTSYGLAFSHNGSDTHYRRMYRNCTHIIGNLEIVFLDRPFGRENVNRSYDLSFLSDIREVTGYVLIVGVHADVIPLTNLRIIRGQSLYNIEGSSRGYGLYVGQNYQPKVSGFGIKELQFTSLHEIMDGSVMFHNNYELCYQKTIDWTDILTGEDADVFYKDDDADQVSRSCGACDQSCEVNGTRRCWGSEPAMCQKLTRNCAPQCDGSCYGPMPTDCCHFECVGGCTGPSKDKCWACRQVVNGNTCEPHCPPELIMNKQGRLVRNPNFKYTYGTVCVEKCPEHLIAVHGSCVSECGDGYYEDSAGKCVRCEGLCPKTCEVTDYVNANNIDSFENCTIINGVLKILQSTLRSPSTKTPPLADVSQLSVFESVREITGALVVQANHVNFTSLSFFKNLRSITGRQLQDQKHSLQILGTSLRTLGLRSLSQIRFGSIAIAQNPNLCHVGSVNWSKVVANWNNPVNSSIIIKNGASANCSVCSKECSNDGCWGPSDSDCLSCAHYFMREQQQCLESCETAGGFYADVQLQECKRCHPECLSACTGPGNDECDSCRNVQDGDYCVPVCPDMKYEDLGQCKPCREGCVGGCTGPGNGIGDGACNFCLVLVTPLSLTDQQYCLPPDTECPSGYYTQFRKDQTSGRRYQECLACHPQCRKCNGPSTSACQECVHFNESDSQGVSRCVSACSSSHYILKGSQNCFPCHSLCEHCFGPSASECTVCAEIKLYADLEHREHSNFTCVETCPDWAPKHLSEITNNHTTTICLTEALYRASVGSSGGKTAGAVVGGIIGAIVLCGLVTIVVMYFRYQHARAEENKARIHAKITGTPIDELEPLAPGSAQPDMAQLRVVKESELQKYEVIGSGAFGTVYKGVWIPAEENVKVIVAIKVLREGSSASQNAELLEEARIMAAAIHPNCTRIIAVCMTAQMMLVMPFVPNGCLLDYVRKNQANIGSKVLLNWGTQIARVSIYLTIKCQYYAESDWTAAVPFV